MGDVHDRNADEGQEALLPYIPPMEASLPMWRAAWLRVFEPQPRPFSTQKFETYSRLKTWGLRLLWVFGVPAYLGLTALLFWFACVAQDMPDTSPLWAPESTPLIVVKDRHGREILRTGGVEAKPVILSDLPPALPLALISIEDRRFYDHTGFDVIGLSRAMWSNIQAGRVVQGGSTITQQLAKNVFLTRHQTLKRKSQELMLAVWLEHRLTKAEILETYLSRVYFGGGTIGIESGSVRFFNKPAHDLSVGEAALLVGLLQAPDRLNPVKDTQASAVRTAQVLMEMNAQGYLGDAHLSKLMQDEITVEPTQVKAVASAQYFTDWILAEVDAKIGAPRHDIVVQTSLDLQAQLAAQAAVTRGANTKRNAQQAALMSFDGTGGVRAMVGGVKYQHSSYNRATRAKRQPGSAFKPFVYLSALRAGMVPWDVREDAPLDIKGWQPGNFSNKFLGALSLETALALSINTVAVSLTEEVGRDALVKTAAMMGLEGFKPYASLALGAQETTLYDLTAAYIPFANWGYGIEPYGLEAVYGTNGDVLYQRPIAPKVRVLDTQILGRINLMMRTVVERGTGKAARIDGRDIGGKTGTTNDYRDAWFVGYTPDMVTGVWVGNDDNSKMARITGGTIPARIWQDFMVQALKDVPVSALPTVARPRVQPASSVSVTAPEQSLEALLAQLEKSLP